MTPGEIQGSINDITNGLEAVRSNMILTSGSDHTTQPFKIAFDPRVNSYNEMRTIMEEIRGRFPQWTFTVEWKQT